VPELDVWAAVLPKAAVPADFLELLAVGRRLVLAIGDAPAVGLRSAFVARFIGNLFHELAVKSGRLSLGEILKRIDVTIRDYDYFKRISMQCADIDPKRGIVHIANAGHPWPVHYSARRGKCDILPLGGQLLHSRISASGDAGEFPEYSLTLGPGDVLTLVTDGLTEDHVFAGEPYGYRFTSIVEARASQGARAIGDAILDDWTAHPRELDMGDDISVIVIVAGEMVGKASS
jgi:serine phosphatase RsbU (regulator of sigma subunit)